MADANTGCAWYYRANAVFVCEALAQPAHVGLRDRAAGVFQILDDWMIDTIGWLAALTARCPAVTHTTLHTTTHRAVYHPRT